MYQKVSEGCNHIISLGPRNSFKSKAQLGFVKGRASSPPFTMQVCIRASKYLSLEKVLSPRVYKREAALPSSYLDSSHIFLITSIPCVKAIDFGDCFLTGYGNLRLRAWVCAWVLGRDERQARNGLKQLSVTMLPLTSPVPSIPENARTQNSFPRVVPNDVSSIPVNITRFVAARSYTVILAGFCEYT